MAARPPVEREPQIQWMEEWRRQKDREHLSQAMVVLYGWSHLVASIEASLLKHTVAALPKPPVSDRTRGVKEAHLISRTHCFHVFCGRPRWVADSRWHRGYTL